MTTKRDRKQSASGSLSAIWFNSCCNFFRFAKSLFVSRSFLSALSLSSAAVGEDSEAEGGELEVEGSVGAESTCMVASAFAPFEAAVASEGAGGFPSRATSSLKRSESARGEAASASRSRALRGPSWPGTRHVTHSLGTRCRS